MHLVYWAKVSSFFFFFFSFLPTLESKIFEVTRTRRQKWSEKLQLNTRDPTFYPCEWILPPGLRFSQAQGKNRRVGQLLIARYLACLTYRSSCLAVGYIATWSKANSDDTTMENFSFVYRIIGIRIAILKVKFILSLDHYQLYKIYLIR